MSYEYVHTYIYITTTRTRTRGAFGEEDDMSKPRKQACGCAAMKALVAITQGSRIRVYGLPFTNEFGIRRKSMALTDEQRRLVREATQHGA